MVYSIEQIKNSIAYCGLVCAFCSTGKSGKCIGCREKSGGCSIKICAQSKKLMDVGNVMNSLVPMRCLEVSELKYLFNVLRMKKYIN